MNLFIKALEQKRNNKSDATNKILLKKKRNRDSEKTNTSTE